MMCSFRCLLTLLAVLATAAGAPAASTGRPPAPPKPHVPKPPPLPKPHMPKPPPPPRLPHASFPVRKAPIHISHTKVIYHPRPVVRRGPVNIRHTTTRIVRQPVRRTAFRTVHRYPVHRVQRRFVRRPYYYYGRRRYSYFYYPGRYRWRTNYYNRGYGLWRPRAIGGIVESVQGIPGNGILLVKVFRPRYGRFRYAAAGRRATSLRRFHLNLGTLYQVMTFPPRGGTVADLRRGERVLILTHTNTANTAQMVRVSPRRRW